MCLPYAGFSFLRTDLTAWAKMLSKDNAFHHENLQSAFESWCSQQWNDKKMGPILGGICGQTKLTKKSRIRETPTFLLYADSSTDTKKTKQKLKQTPIYCSHCRGWIWKPFFSLFYIFFLYSLNGHICWIVSAFDLIPTLRARPKHLVEFNAIQLLKSRVEALQF